MKLTIVVLAIVLVLFFLKYKRVKADSDRMKISYMQQIEEQNHKIVDVAQERDAANTRAEVYAREVEKLSKQLEVVVRERNFYKNIEEDSGNLNAYDDKEERKRSIEEAARQIIELRSRSLDSTLLNSEKSQEAKSLLDSEQAKLCEEIESSNDNFFITGKAGTGKSFLLDVIRKTTQKSHIVLAPTGIAALNVGGVTIHSTFGYYNLVKLDVDAISDDTIHLKSEKRIILQEVSTIIIDEISMVRADTFDKIDRILRVVNHNNKPFGGKQIILFGDLFQLPPIAKSKESDYLRDRYGGIFFFCADAYKIGTFCFRELTMNHRQKDDSEFFLLLNRVRDGSATDTDIAILNSRLVEEESVYDRFTTLLPKKEDVEALNKDRIDQLPSKGYTYHAKVVMNKYPNNNKNLESMFPIEKELYLKQGALVMMVTNDPGHRWVNGTLGIVNGLSDEGISISIDKRTYDIGLFDFTEQEVTYANGKITYEDILTVQQYPVVPAYAITIHKSQGQTYQNIVCDIDKCFEKGQAYVALSRCASLNGLHLKKRITGASIMVDRSVLDFYQTSLNAN